MPLSQEYQAFLKLHPDRGEVQRIALLEEGKDFWKEFIRLPDDLDDLVSNARIPRGRTRLFLRDKVTLDGFRHDIFKDNGNAILAFIEKHKALREYNDGKTGSLVIPFMIVKTPNYSVLAIRGSGNTIIDPKTLNFPKDQHSATIFQAQQFDQQPRTILEQDQPLDLSRSGPNSTNQSSLMHR